MANVDKFHFRLVLLGSNGTGFLFKRFDTLYKPTVEDLFTNSFDLGSIEIKVDFLDTSGSMQFPAMRRLSITTGNAFLIVYAVDDETSYEVLKMCIEEIREIRPDFQEIPIVFAGNKCDIPRERQKVRKETVSNYVHYDLPRLRAKVIECSCKESINIDNIFRAYLSLAKVSLSTASSAASLKGRRAAALGAGAAAPAACEQQQERNSSDNLDNNKDKTRSSSMKVLLGVRKSCDASIVEPRKSASTSTPTGSASPLASSDYSPSASQRRTGSAHNSGRKHFGRDSASQPSTGGQGGDEIVNLETAIQSKLSLRPVAKPRSRSLIWRSMRKSRNEMEATDCRVV